MKISLRHISYAIMRNISFTKSDLNSQKLNLKIVLKDRVKQLQNRIKPSNISSTTYHKLQLSPAQSKFIKKPIRKNLNKALNPPTDSILQALENSISYF